MFKRVAMLLVVIALAFGVGNLGFNKWKIGSVTKPQEINVSAKSPELICPGPFLINPGAAGSNLESFQANGAIGISKIVSGKSGSQTETGYTIEDASGEGSKDFNAVQWQFVDQRQGYGLNATNCSPGLSSGWFVGGDNSVGREALLILINPSQVDATVSLQLYSTSGLIQASGLTGISAPAGKLTVLPISSFAPKVASFSMRVTSRGAALGMWVQQKTMRGLRPGGVDIFGPAAEPSKVQLIPGVFLRGTNYIANLVSGGKDFEDSKPILRLTNTGSKDLTFNAQIEGADGASFGTVVQDSVPAGSTRDFSLNDLADGNYSVTITGDQPLLAAVRFNRATSTNTDLAWAPAIAPKNLDAGFSVPMSGITKLSIQNPGLKSVTVTIGSEIHRVDSQSNIVVAVASGSHLKIHSDGPVSVCQVIDIKSAVAVVPVIDYQSASRQMKVTVR